MPTAATLARPPRPAPARPAAATALRAALAWALPALVFAAVLAAYGIRYDTNDDATIANLAAGAYGPDRLRLVHVSVVMGAALRPLYALAGGVNWYVVVSLALMYLSCVALCTLAMERLGTAGGACLFLALAAAFLPVMIYRFQYVRTTALCMAAGLAWLSLRLGQGARRTWPGVALAAAGSLLRWEMFCAAGGLSAAVLLGRFFRLDRDGKRRAVAAMAALAALVCAAKAADIAAYQLDDGWRAYRAYNAARTEFSDYKVQLLTPGVNAFAGQGVSDTDNAMLLSWDFYDGEVFPTQRIEALNRTVPPLGAWQAVRNTAYTALHLLWGSSTRLAFALTLAACLALVRWGRRSVPMWGTLALLGAELLFLMWRARMTRYVEDSLLFVTVVLLACAAAQAEGRRPLRGAALGAAALALALGVSVGGYLPLREESAYYRQSREPVARAYDAYSADKDHLYLLAVAHLDAAAGYDVWRPRAEGYFSNLVALGGWLSHAPHREAALASAGLASPLPDAVDNSRVYVICDDIDRIVAFASEHLGRPVTARPVEGAGVNVFWLCSASL